MQSLNLPAYNCKLKHSGGNTYIFDSIRKKFVQLTPEEWVRQHYINYLISFLNYPRSLLSVEKGTTYNSLQKRTDLRIYSASGEPLVLVECKASEVKITEETVKQASVYNQTIRAKYIMLTNGLDHYCWKVNFMDQTFQPLPEIPAFDQL